MTHTVDFVCNVWEGSTNVTYCDLCLYSTDCFGCVGLRRKKYCILNKQYTKEEYEKLVPQIIGHMKKTGEFGEFFPMSMSPFAYNDSVASEYYPLSKEEVQAKGLKWREPDAKEAVSQTYSVPDDIKDVTDAVLSETLGCETCGKGFKIIPQELQFYREMKLPIPRSCWICRHWERRALKNPRIVRQRGCTNCGAQIFSTYAPERSEPVYCEKCYLEFVA